MKDEQVKHAFQVLLLAYEDLDALRSEKVALTEDVAKLQGALRDLVFWSRQWLVVLGRMAREQEFIPITAAEVQLLQNSVDWAAKLLTATPTDGAGSG